MEYLFDLGFSLVSLNAFALNFGEREYKKSLTGISPFSF